MAFIAAEFQRNSIYDPKRNPFDFGVQFKSAGKDYAGIMALSYSGNGPGSSSAAKIFRNALPSVGGNNLVKDALNRLQDRLAMVLMYSKKEGAGPSRALVNRVGALGSEDDMKKRYKYLKEFDIKAQKLIHGSDMIDPKDSFGVLAYVVNAMVEISKVQPGGKAPNDRDAAKMAGPPRFEIEKFNKR